jgi:Tfp pilus assembly protein PilV
MNANRSKRCPTPRRRRPRRGYALVEVAISILIAMTAMVVMVKVLGWLGAERRSADRRGWAVQAASNVLERVAAEPFDRVTAETVKSIAAATGATKALPDAAWEIDVADEPDKPVASKRVGLSLRWKERSGGWSSPVRLTSWVFRKGGKS